MLLLSVDPIRILYIKVQNWPFPTTLLAKLDCMDKCNYIQKDLHDSYVFNQDKIQHPLLSKEDKDVDKNIYSPGYNFLYIYIHTHIYSSVCNYT